MSVSRADNYVKIWRNLPINNLKPDLHFYNACAKFVSAQYFYTYIFAQFVSQLNLNVSAD